MADLEEQAMLREGDLPLPQFIATTNIRGPRELFQEYRSITGRDVLLPAKAFEENMPLNRWKDIRCFDHCRVPLHPDGYIHANYVDGWEHPKKFICTQAPLTHTVQDFWQLVWQERVGVVVSLTKVGGAKCALYFPDRQGKACTAGDIKISNLSVKDINGHYNRTQMQVGRYGQKRVCIHFLFHQWPDKGNPDSTAFLDFMADVQRAYAQTSAMTGASQHFSSHQSHQSHHNPLGPPMIVHCSAGVGRTGTMVAMDIIQHRLMATRYDPGGPRIALQGTVLALRRRRHCAVQKPEQYIFLYLGVVEYALREGLLDPKTVDVSRYISLLNKAAT